MSVTFEKIVLLRTDRIGEVLLSAAAVGAIKEKNPGARIDFVTSEYSKGLLEGRSDIAKVMTADTMSRGNVFSKALSLSRQLREGGYDAAVVFNPHKMLHLACFLAGIPRRIGYARKWPFLLTDRIEDDRQKGDRHEIECTLELLERSGISAGRPHLILEVDPSSRSKVAELLAKRGVDEGGVLVCVHPGSSNPSKIWPGDNYSELIQRIRNDLGYEVVVLGDVKEAGLADRIVHKADAGAFNLAGELDLKCLAALLKRADLFIGNDTGPMHMAAALRVPVIAIFGRNIPGVSPTRWGPWGEDHIVLHEDLGCDPCFDRDCQKEHECLRAITVDKVYESVKRLLPEGNRRQR
ncbi:MAG: lipopolysaccharide heptosyltransferase II [Candidatus Omnitrophica bacterium]|nr:lipopolysaccharide heptosyltransferase II [Candidatus Omnitrophota bacterium]